MKGLFKKILTISAVLVLAVCCLFSTACASSKVTLEVKVMVYESSKGAAYEQTLLVDLFDGVAPKTVKAITDYAKAGYYDGLTFYTLKSFDGSSAYSSQIMMGDYFYNQQERILQVRENENDFKPYLEGEFKNGGYVGSNLKNESGVIGLWRTWQKGDSYETNNWANTGKATWYVPTTTIGDYDDNFCLFGKIRTTDADTATAWGKITSVCKSSAAKQDFVVFYTGEYNADDSVYNNGLTYNCLPQDDFDELTEIEKENMNIFEAENGQYVKYNKTIITMPIYSDGTGYKNSGARIVSVKVK